MFGYADLDYDCATMFLRLNQSVPKVMCAIEEKLKLEPRNHSLWSMLRQTGCLPAMIKATLRNIGNEDVVKRFLAILVNCEYVIKVSPRAPLIVDNDDILPCLHFILKYNEKNEFVNERVFSIVIDIHQQLELEEKDIFVEWIHQRVKLIDVICRNLKNCATANSNFLDAISTGILLFRTLSNGITIRKSAALKVLQTINFILIFLNKKWKIRFVSQSTLWMTIEELKRYSRAVSTTSNCFTASEKDEIIECFGDTMFMAPKDILEIVNNMGIFSVEKLPVKEVCRCLRHKISNHLQELPATPRFINDIKSLCALLKCKEKQFILADYNSLHYVLHTLEKINEHAENLAHSVRLHDTLQYSLKVYLESTIDLISVLQAWTRSEFLTYMQTDYKIIDVLLKSIEWIAGTSDSLNNFVKKTPIEQVPSEENQLIDLCRTVVVKKEEETADTSRIVGYHRKAQVLKSVLDEKHGTTLKEELIPLQYSEDYLDLTLRILTSALYLVMNFGSFGQGYISRYSKMRVLKMCLKCIQYNGDVDIYASDVIRIFMSTERSLMSWMETYFVPMLHELAGMQNATNMRSGSNYLNSIPYTNRAEPILKELATYLVVQERIVVAEKLKTGSDFVKKNLVLLLPYFEKNMEMFHKFLTDCDGLGILLKNLQQDSKWRNWYIRCLSKIVKRADCAKQLTTLEIDISKAYEPSKSHSMNVCAFKLDSGCIVYADRNFLCEKSSYFSVLLSGAFKEAQEEEIALQNVDEDSFNRVLNLLNCDIRSDMLLKLDLNVQELLDVIHLADHYLLVDLCDILTESLIQLQVTADNTFDVYQWAVNYGIRAVRIGILEHILMARNINEQEQFSMFKNIFELKWPEVLIEDLRQIGLNSLNVINNKHLASKLCYTNFLHKIKVENYS